MAIASAGFLLIDDVDGEMLRDHHMAVRSLVDLHPIAAPIVAVLLYALVVAGFLPIALWVTIACGLAFGTFWGGILSVLGATLGAVVTFLVARTSVGQPLRQWAGPWLHKLEIGFRKGVWSYLLLLRMVPAFPFWLINIVPALLGVPLSTFVLTTALGIAPATFVLASVGAGLGDVLSRGGTVDWDVMTKPSVLGPLIAVSALAAVPALWRYLRPST